jgi:hypothetical protein
MSGQSRTAEIFFTDVKVDGGALLFRHAATTRFSIQSCFAVRPFERQVGLTLRCPAAMGHMHVSAALGQRLGIFAANAGCSFARLFFVFAAVNTKTFEARVMGFCCAAL